jgi:hypothetical protein
MKRWTLILATLLATLATAAPSRAADAGTYGDGNRPAPDVTMEVKSGMITYQARWSADGGTTWTPWRYVTPNNAGSAGDVQTADTEPLPGEGTGSVKIQNGKLRWRAGADSAWKTLKKLKKKAKKEKEKAEDAGGADVGKGIRYVPTPPPPPKASTSTPGGNAAPGYTGGQDDTVGTLPLGAAKAPRRPTVGITLP